MSDATGTLIKVAGERSVEDAISQSQDSQSQTQTSASDDSSKGSATSTSLSDDKNQQCTGDSTPDANDSASKDTPTSELTDDDEDENRTSDGTAPESLVADQKGSCTGTKQETDSVVIPADTIETAGASRKQNSSESQSAEGGDESEPCDGEELSESDEEGEHVSEDVECSDHPRDKTSAYCNTCDEKICLGCIMGEHRQHDFVPFEDKIEAQSAKLLETLKSVSELLEDVATYSSETEQESVKVKLSETVGGFKGEILEKKEVALNKLELQFEEEVEKLREHLNKRKGLVEKATTENLNAMDELLDEELARFDARLEESEQLREAIGTQIKSLPQPKRRRSLAELKATTTTAKNSAGDLEAMKGSLEALPALSPSKNTDFQDVAHLGVKIVNGNTEAIKSQTDMTKDHLEGYRKRIEFLTRSTNKELLKYAYRSTKDDLDYIALPPASRDRCKEYGEGRCTAPCPIEAPDVTKPLRWNGSHDTDVVFVTVNQGLALAHIVGGQPNVEKGIYLEHVALMTPFDPYCSWVVPDTAVAIYILHVDKVKYARAVSIKAEDAVNGSHWFLPILGKMKSLLLKAQSLPASTVLTTWSNQDVISDDLTVKNWAKIYKDKIVLFEKP